MKKKKKNPFIVVVLILFGIYLAVFIAYQNGFYEYKAHNKMTLTKEAMAQFEQDVKDGKEILTSDYIDYEQKDYSNKVSKLGVKLGDTLEDFLTEGMKKVYKVISKLFIEK